MSGRGFTLVELAICLSIMTALIPALYALSLEMSDRTHLSSWHLETADAVRTVSEALRSDRLGGERLPTGLSFRSGDCTSSYTLAEGSLLRSDSCGGEQVLARGVSSLSAEPGGVEVTFRCVLRQNRFQEQVVFIAGGAP